MFDNRICNYKICLLRKYLSAQWCMQEFFIAHHKVMNDKPNYLIPVLMEDLNIDELPRDLQTYLRTHTYIDAREFDLKTLRKRIRFSMPDVPLSELRRKQNQDEQEDQEIHCTAAAEMEPDDTIEV